MCICYRNSFSQTVPVFLCLCFVFLLLRFFISDSSCISLTAFVFLLLRFLISDSFCISLPVFCVSVTEILNFRQFLYFSDCVCVSVKEILIFRQFLYFSDCVLRFYYSDCFDFIISYCPCTSLTGFCVSVKTQ